MLNTSVATLLYENERHTAQVSELERKKKCKKVAIDPNKQFAWIDDIKEALDAAKEQEIQWQARQPELEAKAASEVAAKLALEDMCIEWQIIL